MSDIKTNTVTFRIARDQVNLRLFELPDELATLLTSDASTTLQIKSSEPSTSTNGPTGVSAGGISGNAANNAFAVLCTNDKTYHIRQVQTSNSLYVVQSDTGRRLIAIATCPATIELSQAASNKPNEPTAQQHLHSLLVEWDSEQQPPMLPKDAKSAKAIYDDVPFSSAEIDLAWLDICAFTYEDIAYFPSSSVLLSAWSTIMNIALAESGTFNPASLSQTVWRQAPDETSLPQQLFDALHARISMAGEAEAPQRTAIWLAKILLDSESQEPQDRSTFMARWTELLGEEWKDHATLAAITSFTDQSDPTTIMLKSSRPVAANTATSNVTDATASKRKWHERFKKNR